MRNDPSLNHVVRALQQRLRHGDAERLCGLQVDHQLELGWLLYRDIGGLRALENLVDLRCQARPLLTRRWTVGQESPLLRKAFPRTNCWYATVYRAGGDALLVRTHPCNIRKQDGIDGCG